MKRWKVWREWPLPSETPDAWEPWCAWDGEHLYSAQFRTHAEALAYADRQARTREVVLPRLGAAAVEVLGREGFIPYSPENAETIALSMLAYRELALAEKENNE